MLACALSLPLIVGNSQDNTGTDWNDLSTSDEIEVELLCHLSGATRSACIGV